MSRAARVRASHRLRKRGRTGDGGTALLATAGAARASRSCRVACRTSRLVATAVDRRRSSARDTCQPPTCHPVRRPGWRSSRCLVLSSLRQELSDARHAQPRASHGSLERDAPVDGDHRLDRIRRRRVRRRQRAPEAHPRRGRHGRRRVRPGDEGPRPGVHRLGAARRGADLHPEPLGQARRDRHPRRRRRRHQAPSGDRRRGGDQGGRALRRTARAARLPFTVAGPHDLATDKVAPIEAATKAVAAAHPSVLVEGFGDATSGKQFDDKLAQDFHKAEVLSIPITLVILIVAFGALLAAGIPVLLGLTSVFAAFGLTTISSQFVADGREHADPDDADRHGRRRRLLAVLPEAGARGARPWRRQAGRARGRRCHQRPRGARVRPDRDGLARRHVPDGRCRGRLAWPSARSSSSAWPCSAR